MLLGIPDGTDEISFHHHAAFLFIDLSFGKRRKWGIVNIERYLL